MKRILLSLLTIAVVGTTATGATLAYFTSSQTFSANIVTTGSLNFVGVITNLDGSTTDGKLSVAGLAPGKFIERCLWVRNAGDLAGRFKLYRGTTTSGIGSTSTLGKELLLSLTMNPSGEKCAIRPVEFAALSVYGQSDFANPTWLNVPMYGGSFDDKTTTPFLIGSDVEPMQPGYFAVYLLKVMMDSDVTGDSLQNKTFGTAIELLGMQAEGSEPGLGWDPMAPTP